MEARQNLNLNLAAYNKEHPIFVTDVEQPPESSSLYSPHPQTRNPQALDRSSDYVTPIVSIALEWLAPAGQVHP